MGNIFNKFIENHFCISVLGSSVLDLNSTEKSVGNTEISFINLTQRRDSTNKECTAAKFAEQQVTLRRFLDKSN